MAIQPINYLPPQQFAKGGIKKLEIASYVEGGQNIVISTTNNAQAVATIGSAIREIKFKRETGSMTTTMTSDGKGKIMYETVIEVFVPQILPKLFYDLRLNMNDPLIAKVSLYNTNSLTFIVGWDSLSAESASECDAPLHLTSAVAESGSGLSDENGTRLTFTCVAPSPPVGTLV